MDYLDLIRYIQSNCQAFSNFVDSVCVGKFCLLMSSKLLYPRISRTPNFERFFLEKSAAYTRVNTVLCTRQRFVNQVYIYFKERRGWSLDSSPVFVFNKVEDCSNLRKKGVSCNSQYALLQESATNCFCNFERAVLYKIKFL